MLTHDDVRAVIAEILSPGGFCVPPDGRLRVEHQPVEVCRWEVFRGHLLDATQTRLEKTFESWTVWLSPATGAEEQPLLSIKFDRAEQRIYVTRSLRVHGWEAYPEGNAILSREKEKWQRELIGTLDLGRIAEPARLRQQLAHDLFLAVVGTSRLPITSLESPLPAFALGHFGYLPCQLRESPLLGPRQWIDKGMSHELTSLQRAKLLELVLRGAEPKQVEELPAVFLERWRALGRPDDELVALQRTLFNHVALSPYTALVDNWVRFLAALGQPLGIATVVDLLSYLLRHLVRHLTAFDLRTFHNLGANYPDAPALDALLRAYVSLMNRAPNEFEEQARDDERTRWQKRRRRRALRQAWLMRKQCEGLPVPDLPTSPGENLRVLPEPFVRVPEEQLTQPWKRRTRLFANQPAEQLLTETARRLLQQSIRDLEQPEELLELGMAVYLDRPLGVFKEPGAVDRTPLLSYEAFSRSIAMSRLADLERWGLLTRTHGESLRQLLSRQDPKGVPVTELTGRQRPGVVALEDAARAARDFVFLRTTGSSLNAFLSRYDFGPLQPSAPATAEWLTASKRVLLIRSPRSRVKESPESFLTLFDADMQPRLELGLGQEDGASVRYVEWDGEELLEQGLRVLRLWETKGTWRARDIRCDNVLLTPRMTEGQPVA